MARTLLDFAKSMDQRAIALSTVGNERAVKAVTAIVNDLAIVSPVDTSLFISNWQVRLNVRAESPIPAYVLGSAGSTKSESGRAMIEAAMLVLATKKPGDVVYISNVLPYAGDLDMGTSSQSPAGFVHRAALIGRKVMENNNV